MKNNIYYWRKKFQKTYFHFFIIAIILTLLLSGCSEFSTNKEAIRVDNLYGQEVAGANITCQGINRYTDPSEALGPPNAGVFVPGSRNYYGFVSLGIDGSIMLRMSLPVADGSGNDIRVYQSVSSEPLEVWVSPSMIEEFVSLGIKNCSGHGGPFNQYCEFDIKKSGYKSIRYVFIKDKQRTQIPDIYCYESAGADIDAVQGLYATLADTAN
ncbi:MAG: hypothetical protein ACETWC_08570 [Acidobacteriota bacterium]